MATYHFTAKIISRKAGQSAVASAAYRHRMRIKSEHDGLLKNYEKTKVTEDLAHSEIHAPSPAPDWISDRSQLWNRIERVEKRVDAQLARDFEMSLPRELSVAENAAMVGGFVQENFVSRGLVADVAIHDAQASDGEANIHAHVMVTQRPILESGEFGAKDRGLNARPMLENWRKSWADHVNAALERGGHDARIDHRSLKERAEELREQVEAAAPDEVEALQEKLEKVERSPLPKLGPQAVQMMKRGEGEDLKRVKDYRAAQEANKEEKELSRQLTAVRRRLAWAAKKYLPLDQAKQGVADLKAKLKTEMQRTTTAMRSNALWMDPYRHLVPTTPRPAPTLREASERAMNFAFEKTEKAERRYRQHRRTDWRDNLKGLSAYNPFTRFQAKQAWEGRQWELGEILKRRQREQQLLLEQPKAIKSPDLRREVLRQREALNRERQRELELMEAEKELAALEADKEKFEKDEIALEKAEERLERYEKAGHDHVLNPEVMTIDQITTALAKGAAIDAKEDPKFALLEQQAKREEEAEERRKSISELHAEMAQQPQLFKTEIEESSQASAEPPAPEPPAPPAPG